MDIDISIIDKVAEKVETEDTAQIKHKDIYQRYDFRNFLIAAALPFVGLSLFFGTKGGYYDSDDYTGDGCAHDVKR